DVGAVALRDPAAFARRIEVCDEVANDAGDQPFEPLVPAILLGIEHAVSVHDPPHVAGLVPTQQIRWRRLHLAGGVCGAGARTGHWTRGPPVRSSGTNRLRAGIRTSGNVRAFITDAGATVPFLTRMKAVRAYTSCGVSEPGALRGIAR